MKVVRQIMAGLTFVIILIMGCSDIQVPMGGVVMSIAFTFMLCTSFLKSSDMTENQKSNGRLLTAFVVLYCMACIAIDENEPKINKMFVYLSTAIVVIHLVLAIWKKEMLGEE